jgi:hypothetical protein
MLTLLFGFGGYMHQQQKCVEKVLVVFYIYEMPKMAIMRDDRRDVTGTENVKLINKIETVNIQQTFKWLILLHISNSIMGMVTTDFVDTCLDLSLSEFTAV